jgi:ABC-type lipoprotein export system ATPase subunit
MTLLAMTGIVRHERAGARTLQVLDGVDVEVAAGQFVVVAGPSGSGKSTLVHIAAGWVAPTAGEVTWYPPIDDPGSWAQVGLVPQRLGLLPELSARGNVRWPLRLARRDADDRASDLESGLGLTALRDRRCGEISLGEQQRVAVARALVLRPHLLVVDEPTGHQTKPRRPPCWTGSATTATGGVGRWSPPTTRGRSSSPTAATTSSAAPSRR